MRKKNYWDASNIAWLDGSNDAYNTLRPQRPLQDFFKNVKVLFTHSFLNLPKILSGL